MSKLITEITLEKIGRIQNYVNTDRKTPEEIKAETGADYLVNGGLYNPNWTACCHLKADGYIWAEDPYNYWGYAWDAGADIEMCAVPAHGNDKSNYICCCELITPYGPVARPLYTSEQGGRRGRTAMGLKDGRLCLYVSEDGTKDDETPEELRDELAGLGWTNGIMLDSGSSSQCDFQGEKIGGDKPVHNLLLVFLKKGETMKKVCLDPGHGVEIAGKCAPDQSYYEHEFALDLAKRMAPILTRHGVEVTMTRSGEHALGLTTVADCNARVKLANGIAGLNLYVSIHSNAAGNDGWYSAKGLSIITSAAGDTAARNVAANAMLARFREAGITLRSTPLTHDIGLIVLRKTTAPAVLIEHGFHTNREEVELLKSSDYRDKLAEAECKGILDFLGIAWIPETDYQAAVQVRFGFTDKTMEYLAAYQYAGDLFRALAEKE